MPVVINIGNYMYLATAFGFLGFALRMLFRPGAPFRLSWQGRWLFLAKISAGVLCLHLFASNYSGHYPGWAWVRLVVIASFAVTSLAWMDLIWRPIIPTRSQLWAPKRHRCKERNTEGEQCVLPRGHVDSHLFQLDSVSVS